MRCGVLGLWGVLGVVALVGWGGIAQAEGGSGQPGLSDLAKVGRAAMEKAQCNRCHAISDPSGADRGIASADRGMHCVDCHTWILGTRGDEAAIAEQRQVFPDWDRYLENIVHFTALPDLGTLTRRVKPGFVRTFLDAPFDLRPHLDESMIPVQLSAKEKDAVVAFLSELSGVGRQAQPPASTEAIPAAQVEAGRKTFVAEGCVTCHVVGDLQLIPGFDAKFYAAQKQAAPADFLARLAPDLRHVRQRVDRAVLERFVQDPKAVDPASHMPKFGVTAEEARRIADFLYGVELKPLPEVKQGQVAADAFPVLDRKVAWDEVYDEVLGMICVHCHMHPESNNGDGGAGNSGGLGWAGASLNLETYEGVKQGLKRAGDTAWTSVIARGADGAEPLMWQALTRRHAEAARDTRAPFAQGPVATQPTDGTHPGMPLGLPPLSKQQMQIMRTWLAQGAPGPAE